MSALIGTEQTSGSEFAPLLCEPLIRRCLTHFEVLPPGSRIVDIGCGGAQMVEAFTRLSFRAFGLDVDLDTLGARRFSGRTVAADAERLPLATASCDGIFSFSVFQYVHREAALSECHRVLRKGGRFAIVENLAGNPLAKLDRMRRRFAGEPYPALMTPRNHLSWEGRRIYEKFFPGVTYEAHHMLAPAFLLSKAVRDLPSPNARRTAAGAYLVRLQTIEQSMVNLPGLAALAWHAVICGSK